MDALFLDSFQLFVTPWTVAYQASPSKGIYFPGKSTGVDCHFLLQRIFLTKGSNPGLCIAGTHFTLWATKEAQINIETLLMNISKLFVRKSFPCFLILHQKYRFTIGQIYIVELPVKGLTWSLYKVGVIKQERWETS